MGFPDGASAKGYICQYSRCKKLGFDLWVRKIPWRRAWQPTPVFLPGESPWTEKPGGLQSMESPKVRHNRATKHVCTVEYYSVIKNNKIFII